MKIQTKFNIGDKVIYFTDMTPFGQFGEPEFAYSGVIININIRVKTSYTHVSYDVLDSRNCMHNRVESKILHDTKKVRLVVQTAIDRFKLFYKDHKAYKNLANRDTNDYVPISRFKKLFTTI